MTSLPAMVLRDELLGVDGIACLFYTLVLDHSSGNTNPATAHRCSLAVKRIRSRFGAKMFEVGIVKLQQSHNGGILLLFIQKDTYTLFARSRAYFAN